MIVRNFNLHLNAGHSIPLVINVNQYDQGEQWVFTLFNSDGTQYVPSTGAIVGIKSDGLGIINSGSVVDGKVVINETQQMTAAVGEAVFELLIDDQTHGTANFIVLVEPKPGDQADLSESDLSLIQQAIDHTSPAAIAQGVADWMSENLTPTTPVVDASLTVQGAAADSAKVGQEISDLKSQIAQSTGMSADFKVALENLLSKVAYIDDDGQTYLNALHTAMYPPANLTSITAVYTQSGTVYDTDSLDSLKSDLVVTATWSNQTTSTVASADYTLSGTLAEGTSTITASYGGKTTTFNVTVTHDVGRSDMDGWTNDIPYTNLEVVNNSYVQKANGGIGSYNGWDRTGYVPCDGASNIILPPFAGTDQDAGEYNWFYDSSKNPVSKITANKADRKIIEVPSTANYFVLSQASAVLSNVLNSDIVPNGQGGNWTDGVAYDITKYSPVLADMYISKTNGLAQTSSGWEVLEYVDCEGASTLTFSSNISVDLNYCVFYTSTGAFAGTFETNNSSATVINVPSTASYFRLSAENAKMAQILDGTVTITPNA